MEKVFLWRWMRAWASGMSKQGHSGRRALGTLRLCGSQHLPWLALVAAGLAVGL